MSDGPLMLERGTQVVTNDERKPILYDHKDRPLERQVGFRPREESRA